MIGHHHFLAAATDPNPTAAVIRPASHPTGGSGSLVPVPRVNPGRTHRRHLSPAEVRGHSVIHRRSLPTTTLGWQMLADACITHER